MMEGVQVSSQGLSGEPVRLSGSRKEALPLSAYISVATALLQIYCFTNV